MQNSQILIGYSIRSLLEDKSWTQDRRQHFLINPNIDLPKSVSTSVWENIDDFIEENDDYSLFLSSYGFQDRKELSRLSCYNKMQTDKIMVRSCLHYLHFVPTFVWALGMLPYQDDDGFFFMGYDIADGGMTSGLFNCGYNTDELKYCKERYFSSLNHHGLFESFDIALDFLHYTNKRVEDHAPFYIYSLYSDKKI